MQMCLLLVTLLALYGLSDAAMVRNEAAKFYVAFIFGLHIPLVCVVVGIVYIVSWYKESQSNQVVPIALTQPRPVSTRSTRRPITPWTSRPVKVPGYWYNSYSTDIKYENLKEIETKAIKILVYSLWEPTEVGKGLDTKQEKYKYIHIRRVQRVRHSALYGKYLAFKGMMKKKKSYISYFKEIGKPTSTKPVRTTEFIQATPKLNHSYLAQDIDHQYNEHYLFHGTHTAKAKSICRHGLSTYFAGGGLYGKGVYTAENPTKSDQYSDHASKDNTLLLVRVCLGDVFILRNGTGASELTSAPCSVCYNFHCSEHKLRFDSVVTDVDYMRYREFVVYRDNRTYPEYIITYDRVPDDTEMRAYMQRY